MCSCRSTLQNAHSVPCPVLIFVYLLLCLCYVWMNFNHCDVGFSPFHRLTILFSIHFDLLVNVYAEISAFYWFRLITSCFAIPQHEEKKKKTAVKFSLIALISTICRNIAIFQFLIHNFRYMIVNGRLFPLYSFTEIQIGGQGVPHWRRAWLWLAF